MSDPVKSALDLLHSHPEAAPLVSAIATPDPRDFTCHSCGADVPNGTGCCRACALDYEFEAREEREREGLGSRRPKD